MFVGQSREGSSRHLIRTRDRLAAFRKNIPGRADREPREGKAIGLKERAAETGQVYISSDHDPAGDGMPGAGNGHDRGAGCKRHGWQETVESTLETIAGDAQATRGFFSSTDCRILA